MYIIFLLSDGSSNLNVSLGSTEESTESSASVGLFPGGGDIIAYHVVSRGREGNWSSMLQFRETKHA